MSAKLGEHGTNTHADDVSLVLACQISVQASEGNDICQVWMALKVRHRRWTHLKILIDLDASSLQELLGLGSDRVSGGHIAVDRDSVVASRQAQLPVNGQNL